jgi:hypothetical protein
MFIIYRQTKQPKETFTAEDAYRGPACAYAGVEPGQVYEDRKAAEVDASWLFRSSSSNYRVVEVQ